MRQQNDEKSKESVVDVVGGDVDKPMYDLRVKDSVSMQSDALGGRRKMAAFRVRGRVRNSAFPRRPSTLKGEHNATFCPLFLTLGTLPGIFARPNAVGLAVPDT